MPKNTFFRLDEARREEISNRAMQLFVDHLYEDISMKMVLDSLSMHPGTFYRYFEDKDDLYCLLIRNVTRKKLRILITALKIPYSGLSLPAYSVM